MVASPLLAAQPFMAFLTSPTAGVPSSAACPVAAVLALRSF